MQKVAVIGKIIEVHPIEGADFIMRAVVVCGDAGKWSGVVGKDIAVGEIVTVFLQDAILPPSERWPFMEKHGWRVRMARFKKVPSECVIVKGAPDLPIGTDLAEALGVTKYEKPIPVSMAGEFVGAFPALIPKTDEPNFQTVEDYIALLAGNAWYATEKADGTSCTVYNDEAGMHVCSRNWELREFTATGGKNAYWMVARKYGMDRLPQGLALQFEVVGPGIQSNPMGLTELEARAFTLRDIREHKTLPRLNLECECAALGVPLARLVWTSNLIAPANDDALRELAQIKYPNGKHAEGLVFRCLESAWSFKVINLLYKD